MFVFRHSGPPKADKLWPKSRNYRHLERHWTPVGIYPLSADRCNDFLRVRQSVKHKGLEEFFYIGAKKGIRPEHADRLFRILDRLNAAHDVKDMSYPGSKLHKLSGNLQGQFSVHVSGNWRVFFEFVDGDAYIVNYADYH